MNKRRGFTLIELLAVIVILAVIALIAYPLILGVIKSSKENAFKDSVFNTETAAYNYLANQILFKSEPNETCYIFDYSNDVTEVIFVESKDGKNYYKAPTNMMDVKNDNFTEGNIVVCEDKTISTLSNGTSSYVSGDIQDGDLSSNDKTKPVINDITFSSNSRTITVSVNATEDDLGKINKYYYSINRGEYIESSNNTYTFDSLESNKEYEISVKVTNMALLEETMVKKTSTIEISSPTYTITPSGYATSKILKIVYPVGYTNEYSLDSGDTWNEYTTPVIFNTNGSVIARVSDGLNYVNGSSFTVSNIDTTAPTASLATTSITSKSILLTATCADAQSGISKYEFSKDNGTTYVSNGTTSTYTFGSLTTGSYSFKARCTNGSGLTTIGSVSGTTSAIAVPTYSVSPAGYTTSKTVTITYPSGYTNEYSTNGGTSWTAYTAPIVFSANGSVIARVNDGTNYVSGSSFTVSNIDTTAPTASLVTTSITSKSILLTATCADAQSGISKYEFSKDNGTTYISNGTTSTYTFGSLTTGSYSFKARCTNGSGLTTIGSVSGTTTAIAVPTYSITPAGYATSKTVTITYPTGYTNEYSTNGGTSWTAYTAPIVFSANGSVIARVNDGTNYVSGSSFTVSNIDTTAPTVSVTLSAKVGTITLGDNIALTGYAVTNSTTVPTTWTTVTGTSSTQTYTASTAGTYYAWVKDSAGNTNSKTFIITPGAFCTYAAGKTWNFAYTGAVQNFTVPCDGTYKIEITGGSTTSAYNIFYCGTNCTYTAQLYGARGGLASANFGFVANEILKITLGYGTAGNYRDTSYANFSYIGSPSNVVKNTTTYMTANGSSILQVTGYSTQQVTDGTAGSSGGNPKTVHTGWYGNSSSPGTATVTGTGATEVITTTGGNAAANGQGYAIVTLVSTN